MLDSKNSAIKDLQYELARVCKVKKKFSWHRIVAMVSILTINKFAREIGARATRICGETQGTLFPAYFRFPRPRRDTIVKNR